MTREREERERKEKTKIQINTNEYNFWQHQKITFQAIVSNIQSGKYVHMVCGKHHRTVLIIRCKSHILYSFCPIFDKIFFQM